MTTVDLPLAIRQHINFSDSYTAKQVVRILEGHGILASEEEVQLALDQLEVEDKVHKTVSYKKGSLPPETSV